MCATSTYTIYTVLRIPLMHLFRFCIRSERIILPWLDVNIFPEFFCATHAHGLTAF